METQTCPVCSERLPVGEIERHVNSHFEGHPAVPSQPPRGHERERHDGGNCFSVTTTVTAKIRKIIEEKPLRANPVVEFFISEPVDHFSTMPEDRGWGCGFRNIQICLSHLVRVGPFDSIVSAPVPPIPELQEMLERAWRRGFDPQGARSFGNQVVRTRKRIGATECACLLRSLGVRTRLHDFDGGDAPRRMVDFAWQYFRESSRTGRPVAPVFFQQQGHSRTLVGAERRKDGETVLLILDPSMPRSEVQRALVIENDVRSMRRSIRSFTRSQYQLVTFDGIIGSSSEAQASKAISSTRH